MWLDLKTEIAGMFEILAGCGLPGEAEREGYNVGFRVWDPEKRNADAAEARQAPGYVAKRKAKRERYRETENAAARRYRADNGEAINARRREAYAKKAA